MCGSGPATGIALTIMRSSRLQGELSATRPARHLRLIPVSRVSQRRSSVEVPFSALRNIARAIFWAPEAKASSAAPQTMSVSGALPTGRRLLLLQLDGYLIDLTREAIRHLIVRAYRRAEIAANIQCFGIRAAVGICEAALTLCHFVDRESCAARPRRRGCQQIGAGIRGWLGGHLQHDVRLPRLQFAL